MMEIGSMVCNIADAGEYANELYYGHPAIAGAALGFDKASGEWIDLTTKYLPGKVKGFSSFLLELGADQAKEYVTDNDQVKNLNINE